MLIQEHQAGIAAHTMAKKDTMMKLICIEGVIGAGKSTLTKALAEMMGAKAMYEPVVENPYLSKFYENPKRYALEMQFWLMSQRFEMHEQAIRHIWKTGQSVIMDRSIYGDWVFAKRNWLDGNIENMGYQSYLKHREVMNRYLLVPHLVLHLQAHPQVCLDRIKDRGRECEKSIPVDYLRGLHYLHIELMSELREKGASVYTLDWNEPYSDVNEVVQIVRGPRGYKQN